MIDVQKTIRDFNRRMTAMDFTPEKFCPRVPMHFTTFYRWLNNEREPTIQLLTKFDKALNRAEARKRK